MYIKICNLIKWDIYSVVFIGLVYLNQQKIIKIETQIKLSKLVS
jgi:hypothetical protein